MAVTVQISAAARLLQSWIKTYCTTHSIASAAIPFTDAVGQYKFKDFELPCFMIELHRVSPNIGPAANDVTFCGEFVIHRMATRMSGGNALFTQIDAIGGLLASFIQDHTLGGKVNDITWGDVMVGETNVIQQVWKMNGLNPEVVAVSVPITLEWAESRQ